jgi:hypothetical protein
VGIGATGSNYRALRVQRDLLARGPDFVVVEYSVADGNSQESAETREGLLRQVLKRPNQPAVALLFMMYRQDGNVQQWHSKVGLLKLCNRRRSRGGEDVQRALDATHQLGIGVTC